MILYHYNHYSGRDTNTSLEIATNRAMATAPLTVPPLQKGDRIEDWSQVFEAGTQHVRAVEDGEKRAIQLLPAYVNRDFVDREAVRDIVKKAATLEEALTGLSQVLDPPMDTFSAMQEVS